MITTTSTGILMAVPAPFKPKIAEWMLGTPQPVDGGVFVEGGEGGMLGPISIGTLKFDGYVGPEGFICGPLLPDIASSITSEYGVYRSPTYNHSGIDYSTEYSNGHNVITPMSGKVVFVGNYPGWGNSILIENNGYQVLLSHATDINHTVGDVVNAGDVVMTSGGANGDWRDGNSSGPHLHFEVRHCVAGDDGEEAVCQALDPSSAMITGQTSSCVWNTVYNRTHPEATPPPP